jgi:hypothetical protein
MAANIALKKSQTPLSPDAEVHDRKAIEHVCRERFENCAMARGFTVAPEDEAR